MSHALDDTPASAPEAAQRGVPAIPVRLSRAVSPTAIWTLFAMTLVRNFRARRLVVLGLLYLMPIGLVLMTRAYAPPGSQFPQGAEAAMLLYVLPHALIPLTALLYAPGLIQDEVEEQTLTYLLVRPLPRWMLYAVKLSATVLATSALAAVATLATEAVIWWGDEEFAAIVPEHSAKFAALFALSLAAYNAIFGCLGLVVRKSLALGMLYIIFLEGFLSYYDFVFRRFTVIYYFRVLTLRWIDERLPGWSIDLSFAPVASECVWTLLAATLALTALAAYLVGTREFRVKTPEAT